jgi:tripartite-type tricarboxylate transporter receptor subunit TctC
MPDRRTALQALAALTTAALTTLPGVAAAQSDKTVRFVLPNATGSGVDAITRAAQSALGKALGATVVVDNQPGAGGVVGLQTIARAAPDGHTLGVVSNNVVIFPSVLKSLPFAMPGDFTLIAVCGYTPVVLVVNPAKVAAKNSAEFTALLKSKPGRAQFRLRRQRHHPAPGRRDVPGRGGRQGPPHPLQGVGPMVTDLIGGQIEFATAALPSVQQHIKSGALRAIGVGTAQRVPAAADIPTFVEQGVPATWWRPGLR